MSKLYQEDINPDEIDSQIAYLTSLQRRNKLREKRQQMQRRSRETNNYTTLKSETQYRSKHIGTKPQFVQAKRKSLLAHSVYAKLQEQAIMHTTVQFKQWSCLIDKAHYVTNKQLSIRLVDETTYEPIAVATVCLPDYNFKPNQTAIKDYAENEGMLTTLVEAGIVRDTGIRVHQQWVVIPVVEIIM